MLPSLPQRDVCGVAIETVGERLWRPIRSVVAGGGPRAVREQIGNVSEAAGRGGVGPEIRAVGRRAVGRHAPHGQGHGRRAAVFVRPVGGRRQDDVSGHGHQVPAGRGHGVRQPVPGRGPDGRRALPHPAHTRLGHQPRVAQLARVPDTGRPENRPWPRAVRRDSRPAGRVRDRAQRPRGRPAAGVHVRVPCPADGPRLGRPATVDQGLQLRGRRGPERRDRAVRVPRQTPRRRGPGGRAQRRVRHHAVQPVRHAGHPGRAGRR